MSMSEVACVRRRFADQAKAMRVSAGERHQMVVKTGDHVMGHVARALTTSRRVATDIQVTPRPCGWRAERETRQ
jgi:hypothetical protein